MKRRLIVSVDAEGELGEASDWYEAKRPELGIKNPLIADTYTVDGLVEALIERFAGVRT